MTIETHGHIAWASSRIAWSISKLSASMVSLEDTFPGMLLSLLKIIEMMGCPTTRFKHMHRRTVQNGAEFAMWK